MNNLMTEEIVATLRHCTTHNCIMCPAYSPPNSKCFDTLAAACDRLEELSALKEHQRWIPVTERLPEDEGEKFIKYGFEHNGEISERRFMGVASYYLHDENPHWNGEGFHGMKVTHWMEPPKE